MRRIGKVRAFGHFLDPPRVVGIDGTIQSDPGLPGG
jgi:hypothetical protein